MRLSLSELLLATSNSEPLPTDDIDRLFGKLNRLEPPEDIVQQVLKRLKLPPPGANSVRGDESSSTSQAADTRKKAAE